jgi:hypothetical protein
MTDPAHTSLSEYQPILVAQFVNYSVLDVEGVRVAGATPFPQLRRGPGVLHWMCFKKRNSCQAIETLEILHLTWNTWGGFMYHGIKQLSNKTR